MKFKPNKFRLSFITALVVVLLVSFFALPIQATVTKERLTIQRVNLNFIVDGQVYHTSADQQSFIYKGRTYVPIRFASYVLEKWVSWNQSTATVSILEPTEQQLKQLSRLKEQYLSSDADSTKTVPQYRQQSIVANKDAANYVFFGKKQVVPEDSTTFLYDGTIYVPIRFFSDMIQLDLRYDGETKSIYVTTTDKESAQLDSENGLHNSDGNETDGSPNDSVDGMPNGGANKPTRESIVSEASSKLDKLEASCRAGASDLFSKYTNATTAEERNNYSSQGFDLLDRCDEQVESIIQNMENKLTNNSYELGDDAANFRQIYWEKKAEMYADYIG